MSLAQYNKKRHFNKTPEPVGKKTPSKGVLRFVVQKHDASSLHYDFRLEMKGVLKSWAIPKGPSLNPAEKRLAVHVEDHPYEYRNFEGVIPEGEYGGGTVIVWDEGTYELAEGESLPKEEAEKKLLKGLAGGSLSFILHGKKVQGAFSLRKLKKEGAEKAWLLIKGKDNFATDRDITEEDKSVKSDRTISQVAKAAGSQPHHPEGKKRNKNPGEKEAQLLPEKRSGIKTKPSKKGTESSAEQTVATLVGDEAAAKSRKAAFPKKTSPMLATLASEPFDDDDWLFEIKWDGYRAIAYVKNGNAEIISRNNNSFTETFYPIANALKSMGINAVLDGEIVAVEKNGVANFQALQNWQNTPVTLQFVVFDVLWFNGYDVTSLPLTDRKALLQKILSQNDEVIKYSDYVVGKGQQFFNAAVDKGLEGIMAKKSGSIYELGARTLYWQKIKTAMRQEVVIGGYTAPRNTRKYFGALLLGIYEGNDLLYIGHTGSGFNSQSLSHIYNALQPLVTEDCPFAQCPKGNMPVTWVTPQLVCEIKFTEWTKERRARHPIFLGLRNDKKATDVRFEKSATINKMSKKEIATKVDKAPEKRVKNEKVSTQKGSKNGSVKVKTSGVQLNLQDGEDQPVTIDKHTLNLTSLSKFYWKKEKLSKLDSINYYLKAAPYILPYLLNRPQSLNRHPNGIDAPHFFQKDMAGKLPDWMKTHTDFSESTNKSIEYLLCTGEAALIYMANLGCIEMNPWHSRSESWEKPDWCLIDLDPDKGNTFEQVIEVALLVKDILDSIGADSYVKTSGSSGIHIYIPLGAKYSYNQSKILAELVVNMVNNELPELTSVERTPAKRKGQIYLDFLQNRETQTAAAPYSLRPKRGAPVSTPLHWSEVKKGLMPTTYTIKNIFERLKTEGDLFAPVLGTGIDMQKVLHQLETISTK